MHDKDIKDYFNNNVIIRNVLYIGSSCEACLLQQYQHTNYTKDKYTPWSSARE